MSNILVLTTKYSGTASANGICANNIVQMLEENGHEVTILCYENDICDNKVYIIKNNTVYKKDTIVSKLINLTKSFVCPVINDESAHRYEEFAISLCQEKKIEAVICFFFPLETVTVLKKIKNLFPQICTIIYELDSIGDGIFAASKWHRIATLKYEKWAVSNYEYADGIIIMKSHEAYWKKTWSSLFESKLSIADIPVLVKKEVDNAKNNSSTICMLYGGVLEKKYRSPQYMLELFDKISKKMDIKIHFFSRGDCEQLIHDYSKKNSKIIQHGYVPKEELEEAILKSDVLISIGNSISNSVPSKLINYLSYGKPVVHFSSQKLDVCNEYIEKYPLGINIYEQNPADANMDLLVEFLQKNYNKNVNYSDIVSSLSMNTPQYSAHLINSIIEKYQRGNYFETK